MTYGPSVKEVLLVSNNSSREELSKIKQGVEKIANSKVITYNHPFNYQKINNWAIGRAAGKAILMLNNDIELRPNSTGLIEKMYEMACKKNVGVVGCLLLYGGEKTIQHAGVYLLPGGQADHLYVTEKYEVVKKSTDRHKFPYDVQSERPMSAVTGAAQMVMKDRFDDVGGFDERFIICGGDVDLCLRMNAAGYQTWYVGGEGGYMLHKESQSRKFTPIPYTDFYWSYLSYITGFNQKVGDPFLPKITEGMM
jgi:GT2 family glycosyltransferase